MASCLHHVLCCRQLAVLRLGWNTLGPKGGRALAEGLKYSSTLQQLLLPWSGIGDAGASHIAKALESNSSVRLLDLSGCQVRRNTFK
jgi:Ran GTPase-activating protein (RanGAP) involved in mRNA processing and transport